METVTLKTEYLIIKTLKLLTQALQLPLIEYDEQNLLQSVSLALQEFLLASKTRISYPLEELSLDYGFSSSSEFSSETRISLCLMLSYLFWLINPASNASALNTQIVEVLEKLCSRYREIKNLEVRNN
ncbi:MAG: hypothetical protein ACFFBD_01180 [Candidatus Hodarchaeota archaeon]